MTTYNTGNPVGSADPKDFYDNAENLDLAINGTGDMWLDRLGVSRKSLAGYNKDVQDIVNEAATSASEASTSEQNALASEQAAALSESNASASASAALTSEQNALASEQAAKASEVASASSQSAAMLSEQASLASQQAAKISETNAKQSEIAAASSASAALSSETAAKGSEVAASTSASEATLQAQASASSASDSLASENKAHLWATETIDVPVEVGEFSARHHAVKAGESAAAALASQTAAAASEQAASQHKTDAQAAKTAAEAAQAGAEAAEANAVAVVTGGTATLTAEAGKIPIADANGHIDHAWMNKDELGIQYKPSVSPTLSSDFTENEHKRYEQYGLEPKTILQQWDVARNSTATYFDANGVLQTAGINEPRIDYDPATGECRGLLVERQSTNLTKWSEDLLGGVHFGSATALPNVSPSPDGLFSADKIVGDVGVSNWFTTTAISVVQGTRYTHSRFLKYAGIEEVDIQIELYGAGYGRLGFNVVTGEKTYSGNGASHDDSRIDYICNGWFRVSVSYVAISTGVCNHRVIIPTASDGNTGVYVWGTQTQEGSLTSYIKTEASAVTRVADTITPTV